MADAFVEKQVYAHVELKGIIFRAFKKGEFQRYKPNAIILAVKRRAIARVT